MGRNIKQFIAEYSAEEQAEIHRNSEVLAAVMMSQAETLQPIRNAVKKTQAEVAKNLGVGQVAVSRLEGRSDVYVSTLRRYLRAVGADLSLVVKLKDGTEVALERFGDLTLGGVEASAPKRQAKATMKSPKPKGSKAAPVFEVVPHRKKSPSVALGTAINSQSPILRATTSTAAASTSSKKPER